MSSLFDLSRTLSKCGHRRWNCVAISWKIGNGTERDGGVTAESGTVENVGVAFEMASLSLARVSAAIFKSGMVENMARKSNFHFRVTLRHF